MSIIDLCALTCIGQMTDRRFSAMRFGAPIPDYPTLIDLRAMNLACKGAIR